MTVTRHDAIPAPVHVTHAEHLAWALAKTEAACDPTTPKEQQK